MAKDKRERSYHLVLNDLYDSTYGPGFAEMFEFKTPKDKAAFAQKLEKRRAKKAKEKYLEDKFKADRKKNTSGMMNSYNKGGLPDFSGDGKITKKDVLMGRGVIPKPKKASKGTMIQARGCGMARKKPTKIT
jgi:hypothetical protein